MSEAVHCSHCGALVPPGMVRPGETLQFCCGGCRAVYQLLQESGAGDFYRLRAAGGVLRPEACVVPPALEEQAAVRSWDTEDFMARHVHLQGPDRARLEVYVGGVHCAACVWLLERLPELARRRGVSGVINARLDFGASRLALLYDPQQMTPGGLAGLIMQLGYQPAPGGGGERAARARAAGRDLLLRAAVAGGAAVGTMHLGLYLIGGELTGDQDPATAAFFGWLSCLAALPALVYSARPYYRAAWAAARLGRISIDTNISLVIVFGYLISLVQLMRGSSALYFDAVAMFVAFLLIARLVLHWAREAVTRNLDSMHYLLPRQARRIRTPDDELGELVPTDRLCAGEWVRVGAGEQIPCDGLVCGSPIRVNAALLSGESRPLLLTIGAAAAAGTVCLSEQAVIQVERAGSETRMGRLLAEVHGHGSAEPHGELVERLQALFAPAVALLALVIGAWWWWWAPERAGEQVIALVLACCPCALGLATPLTYAMATGRAAAGGLLLRDAGVIEVLSRVRRVFFDKTGTLTEGRMQVLACEWLAGAADPQLIAALVASEARSLHPAAAAIVEHFGPQAACTITAWHEEVGRGVEAEVADLGTLRIGAAAWCGVSQAPGDRITVGVALAGQPRLRLLLGDPLRAAAPAVLDECRRQGLTPALLSGDHPVVCAALAQQLGIEDVSGGQSPEAKRARVKQEQMQAPVLMVGDGLNDAPALDAAAVAVGIRGGLQAAMDCAHVFCERDDIALVGDLLRGARRARRCISVCLWTSLLYNLAAVALVATGLWGPLVCAVAMPVSSLSVVALVVLWPYFRPRPAARPVTN